MTTSKKLAITQLALASMQLISLILIIISIWFDDLAFTLSSEGRVEVFVRDWYTIGIVVGFYFLIALAILVIGIIQIVFKVKEKTSSVYSWLGVIAILNFAFFFMIELVLILSVMGIAVKEKK